MGTHGSMAIYTASEKSGEPEDSNYLVNLHTTHDGDAITALKDALRLPFFALQNFENEVALSLARGADTYRCDWRMRMALVTTLIVDKARHCPAIPREMDTEDQCAIFLRKSFDLCRKGAQDGHWFSDDPTDLTSLMTHHGSADWFAVPHQLDQDTADYWGSESDILIESGSCGLTRVFIAGPDPEDEYEDVRDLTFTVASRWVDEINAALAPFSLYEIEQGENGIIVQYPYKLVMAALVWHRAFAGGRLGQIDDADGPYSRTGEQRATRAAFGLDPEQKSIPAFGDLAFCFSSTTSASQDDHGVWARMGEFIGARRLGAESLIDKAGVLIATDFLGSSEPLLIRGALRTLADINQRGEPGHIADWLRSILDALPEHTRQHAPEALAFLDQADLGKVVSPARGGKAPSLSL